MISPELDAEITRFIEDSINAQQRLLGLKDDLTIDSSIEETNVGDAALVNVLIKLESLYEIFFEDKDLHRTLYETLDDIKKTILYKIEKKEEFLWGESIAI